MKMDVKMIQMNDGNPFLVMYNRTFGINRIH